MDVILAEPVRHHHKRLHLQKRYNIVLSGSILRTLASKQKKKEPSNRIKTTKADGRQRRDKFGDAINMSREWRQRIHFDRSAGDNPFVCFHLETCHPPPLDGPENCPALQLREAARRTIDMLIIAQTAAKNRATAKRTGSDGVLGFFFFFFSSK